MTFPTIPTDGANVVVEGITYFYSAANSSWTILTEHLDGTSSTFYVSNATASTSTTTGALIVKGGVGIRGNVNIGKTSYIENSQILTTATVDLYATKTSIFAGTDTAVNTSTGVVTIWNTSTLQSVSNRGNSTNNALIISNTTSATSTTTGALTVAGGIGVSGSVFSKDGNPLLGNLLYTPKVTVGTTPHSPARTSDMWIDLNSSALYIWINDNTAEYWLQIAII